MVSHELPAAEHSEHSEHVLRPDADIRADVLALLDHVTMLHHVDPDSVSIEVHDGEVFLRGHVGTVMQRHLLRARAGETPGVTAVHDNLVADPDLAIAVSTALAADARLAGQRLRVVASNGWVHALGEVSGPGALAAVLETAAGLPQVRGICGTPHLAGEPQKSPRNTPCPLQPRPGQPVIARDGAAGHVSAVVVDPRTRLVTDFAVHVERTLGYGGPWAVPASAPTTAAPRIVAVPLAAIDHISDGEVFLHDSLAELTARPPFDAAGFPPAPADWQPPFPFSPGAVYWPVDV
jgi:osmotically-inducible protein OsmY